jgi:DNA-directed RNA polymerase specialized sigma54-like protein
VHLTNDIDTHLTVSQVAKTAGVHSSVVSRDIKVGYLKATKLATGHWGLFVIEVAEAEAYIACRKAINDATRALKERHATPEPEGRVAA